MMEGHAQKTARKREIHLTLWIFWEKLIHPKCLEQREYYVAVKWYYLSVLWKKELLGLRMKMNLARATWKHWLQHLCGLTVMFCMHKFWLTSTPYHLLFQTVIRPVLSILSEGGIVDLQRSWFFKLPSVGVAAPRTSMEDTLSLYHKRMISK